MRPSSDATQVHQRGCPCHWCRKQRTVPLERATAEDMARLLVGDIENYSEEPLDVTIQHRLQGERSLLGLDPIGIVIRADDLTWTLNAETLQEAGSKLWRLRL